MSDETVTEESAHEKAYRDLSARTKVMTFNQLLDEARSLLSEFGERRAKQREAGKRLLDFIGASREVEECQELISLLVLRLEERYRTADGFP